MKKDQLFMFTDCGCFPYKKGTFEDAVVAQEGYPEFIFFHDDGRGNILIPSGGVVGLWEK